VPSTSRPVLIDDRLLIEVLDQDEQDRAILSVLELRHDIVLPDPRPTVPRMAQMAERHPRLNLPNFEAQAVGQLLGGALWLSVEAAGGVLPAILDQGHVPWRAGTIGRG